MSRCKAYHVFVAPFIATTVDTVSRDMHPRDSVISLSQSNSLLSQYEAMIRLNSTPVHAAAIPGFDILFPSVHYFITDWTISMAMNISEANIALHRHEE